MERHGIDKSLGAGQLLSENPPVADLITRLERVLKELWLSEFGWSSIEVFVPVYDFCAS